MPYYAPLSRPGGLAIGSGLLFVTPEQWNQDIVANMRYLAKGPYFSVTATNNYTSGSFNPFAFASTSLSTFSFSWDAAFADYNISNPTSPMVRNPGLYLAAGIVRFPANATGYRMVFLRGPAPNTGTTVVSQACPAQAGEDTILAVSGLFRASITSFPAGGDSNVFNLFATQNSGSTLALTGTLAVTYMGE